jgi:hypothetical protein
MIFVFCRQAAWRAEDEPSLHLFHQRDQEGGGDAVLKLKIKSFSPESKVFFLPIFDPKTRCIF